MISLFENSYMELETADYYFDQRLNSSGWINASDEDKEKALICASKKIDKLNFIGRKNSSTQPMEFPRIFPGALLPTIPEDIKEAVCEEAILLLTQGNSVHAHNQELGIQSVSLGSGSISYRDSQQAGLMSADSYRLVSKWLCKGFDIAQPEFVEAD